MYLERYVSVRTPAKLYNLKHRPGDGLMFSRMWLLYRVEPRWTRGTLQAAGINKSQFENNATYILPELYYHAKDHHTKQRIVHCIVCGCFLSLRHFRKSRKRYRKLCVLDSSELLEKVKFSYPSFDTHNDAFPLSVCTTCQANKLPKRSKSSADHLALAPNRRYPVDDSDRAMLESLQQMPHCKKENAVHDCIFCNLQVPCSSRGPGEKRGRLPRPPATPPAASAPPLSPPPKAFTGGVKPLTRKLNPGDRVRQAQESFASQAASRPT